MSTIKTETLSTPSNSTVPVDTVVNGTAKAWVNFNGTGTVAIRRAFNVSSITDNGLGNYTVNFTTAMSDANYSANVSGGRAGTSPYYLTAPCFESSGTPFIYTASGFQFVMTGSSGGALDSVTLTVSVFS